MKFNCSQFYSIQSDSLLDKANLRLVICLAYAKIFAKNLALYAYTCNVAYQIVFVCKAKL